MVDWASRAIGTARASVIRKSFSYKSCGGLTPRFHYIHVSVDPLFVLGKFQYLILVTIVFAFSLTCGHGQCKFLTATPPIVLMQIIF